MHELFRLAWPGALTLLLHNLYRFNDLFWVGELGGDAALAGQAAVGVAGMVTILTFAFYEGLATGVLAMSARRHGAGEPYRARVVLRVALGLVVLVSAGVAAIGLGTMDALCAFLIDADGSVAAAGERDALAAYLTPIFACGLFLCLSPVVSHAFLAAQDTLTPLYLEIGAVALNTGLNAALVLGVGDWAGLGVAGAGWATIGSRAFTSLAGLWILSRRLPAAGPPEPSTAGEIARTIARVATPVVASIALYSIAYQIVLATTFPAFGATGRAALGCGFTLEGLAFCMIWGLAMATGSLAGNALGAGRPDLASQVVRRSVWIVVWVTTPLALVFLLAPGPLASLITDNADVHREVVVYLRILAWSQLAVGLQQIWDNMLCSAGHSLPTSFSTGFWNLTRIPLCYGFAISLGYGLPGVWWAINLSTFGKAVTAGLVVRRGTWKRVQV